MRLIGVSSIVSALAIMVSVGCGSAPAPTPAAPPVVERPATESPPEDPDALPLRESVLTWDLAGVALPEPVLETSGPFWRAAHAALESEVPWPPSGASVTAYESWARSVLGAWTGERFAAVREMGRLAREAIQTNSRTRPETHAGLGLAMEALALQRLAMPLPAGLGADPQRAAFDAEVIERVAPLLEGAASSYEACTNELTAEAVEWRLFCARRLAALRRTVGPELQPSAEWLAEHRAAARVRAAGPAPAGPAECWLDRPVPMATPSIRGTASDPFAGDVVLTWAPRAPNAEAPLTEAERRALGEPVERRMNTLVSGRVVGVRAAERAAERWRRGARCRAFASDREALRAAFPDHAVGEVSTWCTDLDECGVRVTFAPASSGVSWVATGRVPPDSVDATGWRAAAAALERDGASGFGEAPTAWSTTQTGGWDEYFPDLGPLAITVQRCGGDRPGLVHALYSVDDDHRVAVSLFGEALMNECMRSALLGHRFEPIGSERRLMLAVRVEATRTLRDERYGRAVGDVRVRITGVPETPELLSAVAECHQHGPSGPEAVGVRGEVARSSDGSRADVAPLGGASGPYSECVRRALAGVPAVCETEQATITVCTHRDLQ